MSEQRAHRRGRHAVLAGAGLGDDPPLAHALGQQRLAERVVELVRAGVVEVLALQIHRPARRARRAGARGTAASGARRSRAAARPARRGSSGRYARRLPRLLELRERRHQRLGHELAAVGPEAMLERGARPCWRSRRLTDRRRLGCACACATAAKNARSRSGSLCPGAASVPLAVSTAYGCTTAIASATFSGAEAAAEDQRHASSAARSRAPSRTSRPCRRACPAWRPPSRARRAGGSRRGSARGRARRREPDTCAALITRAPVRRATSAQNDGPSSPCSCSSAQPELVAVAHDLLRAARSRTRRTARRGGAARAAITLRPRPASSGAGEPS